MSRTGPLESFICAECGAEVERLARSIRRSKHRGMELYCSLKCAAAKRRLGKIGPVIQPVGMTSGMLTVTDDLGMVDGRHRVVVSCACGTTGKITIFEHVRTNEYKSCGCLLNGPAHKAATTARLLAWQKAQPKTTLDDLFARCIPIPFAGCWVYTANANSKRRTYFHRVAYELACGPVPNGLELDHLCRVPRCINPEHLEPVTPTVNKQRAVEDRRSPGRVRIKQCIPL